MGYHNHVAAISEWALEGPENLADIITFALLSIRQPFSGLVDTMADVRANGSSSAYLFGFKIDGYRYARARQDEMLADLRDAADENDVVTAMNVLTRVPGLGLAKAGFVAQMLGFPVGCIDSRNAAVHGIDYKTIRLDKAHIKNPWTWHRKVKTYVNLCKHLGGAAKLWNDWCEAYEPGNGEGISARHCEALGMLCHDI